MSLSISETESVADNDTDEEFDWEEVQVPLQPLDNPPETSETGFSTAAPLQTIEIILESRAKPKEQDLQKKALNAALYAERVARVNAHKVHTLCLIANALIRNRWINDELLHARLMSLIPLSIQNPFLTIHKSRIPDAAKRGRVFETSIMRLVEWWAQEYFQVDMTGHIRNKTFGDVQRSIAAREFEFDSDGALLYGSDDDRMREHEIIKSPKSLMKHALLRSGSRDLSAQLFTAVCRALDIPARLVVSLQSVPWQAGVGKPKQSGKKKTSTKGKEKVGAVNEEETDANDSGDVDEDMEEVSIPTSMDIKATSKATNGGQQINAKAKGKQKAVPVIRLRKSRPKAVVPKASRATTPDPTTSPPVFWTEVFSRPDARWLPVDPIRAIVNKRKVFDPSSSSNSRVKQENRMLYVLAFEEDGFAKDVTPRYAKEYGSKIAKMQLGGVAGTGRKEWWEGVLKVVRRPYRLRRDDFEDEELQFNQLTEGMPTSMAGFKGHPLYALARHLKRDEVIHPLVELGKFRGEPVYPRGNVLSLKTAENWTRQGHKIREGCQPMKWVKQRAVTVNKKRAVEMALAEGGDGNEDGLMQGLYAQSQTELYVPDPIVDGIIPKNNFGNIDLYVPSMLPLGAAYIPHKGAAKVARQLGFDYAEAVTSFEFRNRRAIPVISGIVVSIENETTVTEAYWQAEHHRAEKEETKRHAEVLKRWTRLVQGLRIRQRLVQQYKDRAGEQQQEPADNNDGTELELEEPGGFLTAVAGAIQHHSLPRNRYAMATSNRSSPVTNDEDVRDISITDLEAEAIDETMSEPSSAREEEEHPDEFEMTLSEPPKQNGTIKTMQELAESGGSRQSEMINAQAQGDNGGLADSLDARRKKPRGRSSASGRSTPVATRVRASTTRSSGQRRGRKRARRDSSSATDAEPQKEQTSPAKRTKVTNPVVPASDRVLRTRKTKNAAEMEAEKQRELAYTRAVED